MNETDLTDAQIDALVDGQPLDGTPTAFGDFVSAIRAESAATPPVQPGNDLADFFARVELTVSTPVALSAGPSRGKRMFAVVSAFVATATGKLVLGTALAAATVGGAHAAGVVDVPLLPDEADEPVVVEFEDDESDESVGDDETETTDETEATDETETTDEVGDDVDGPAGKPATHGQEVSDFVHETELEGCEKGQAVSDVASANASDHRQNPERDHNPCDKNKDAAIEDVDEVDDDNEDSDPLETSDGAGKSTGKGKTDSAGTGSPGNSGAAPGKADKPGKPDKPAKN
jgi:hypothetical protein